MHRSPQDRLDGYLYAPDFLIARPPASRAGVVPHLTRPLVRRSPAPRPVTAHQPVPPELPGLLRTLRRELAVAAGLGAPVVIRLLRGARRRNRRTGA